MTSRFSQPISDEGFQSKTRAFGRVFAKLHTVLSLSLSKIPSQIDVVLVLCHWRKWEKWRHSAFYTVRGTARCMPGGRLWLVESRAPSLWLVNIYSPVIGQQILSSDWLNLEPLALDDPTRSISLIIKIMENSMSYLACRVARQDDVIAAWDCCDGSGYSWVSRGFTGSFSNVFRFVLCALNPLKLSSVTGRKPFPKRHSGWIRVLWRRCRGWLHSRFSLSQGVALYKQMRILRMMETITENGERSYYFYLHTFDQSINQ